jgi:hypothetical protein
MWHNIIQLRTTIAIQNYVQLETLYFLGSELETISFAIVKIL